jgi:S-adenosylmethionine synthetase
MGHPDKMCDQISDTVLDAILAQDANARVACETLTTTGLVVLAGEVTTRATIDFPQLVRGVVRDIGYTDSRMGFDADTCAVMVAIGKQSPDIAQGVTEGEGLHKEQGAGDQGMMFGYACDETPELMPAPIQYSHNILRVLAEARHSGAEKLLLPDAKSQVTLRYVDGRPKASTAVVLSTQHAATDAKGRELESGDVQAIVQPNHSSRPMNPHCCPTEA